MANLDDLADVLSTLSVTPRISRTTTPVPEMSNPQNPQPDPGPQRYDVGNWDALSAVITSYERDPAQNFGFNFRPDVPMTPALTLELQRAFLQGKNDFHARTLTPLVPATDQVGEIQVRASIYNQGYARAEFLALSSSGPGETRTKAPNVADPEFFEGNPDKFQRFKLQLNLKFISDPRTYGSDAAKIVYASSYLHGAAQESMSTVLDNPAYTTTTTYETFMTHLQNSFADPDRIRTADRKIRALRQGKDPVTIYNAKFSEYAALLGWNENAKMSQFRQGLSDEVKYMLMHRERPTTMDGLLTLAIEVDNAWRSQAAEIGNPSRFFRNTVPIPGQRGWTDSRPPNRQYPITPSPNNPPAPGNRPQSTASGTHPGPMDLSAARNITPQMKQYRRANNLCLYCGGTGHFAAACPNKKKRPEAKIKAAITEGTTAPVDCEDPEPSSENAVILYGDNDEQKN